MSGTPERWFVIQHHRVEVPPEVVFRVMAQETVLLNIGTGQYHGIDPVGAKFFEAMRNTKHVAAACEALVAEYGQSPERIRADFVEFADDMASRGLIRLISPGG